MTRRKSVRFQLTAWYAAVLTAGLALFGGLLWLSLRHRLIGEIDRELEGRAGRFEAYLRSESSNASGTRLSRELDEFCQALPPASYIALHGDNGFAFRFPAKTPAGAENFRVLRRQFTVGSEQFEFEAGASSADADHTLQLLGLLLVSLLPVVVAIACLGGAWLSGRALRPVHNITAAAHTINIENLSERLPVPPTGDEIARLSEVLNTMFARLESAVKTLSQFAADASHELRTPLAVIRTTAELALRRPRSAESYRDSLQQVASEAERMSQLVEELLVLARTDAQTVEMPLAGMDVREVLADVSAEMGSLAEMRQIRIKASFGREPAIISGNRPALHRLFLVLLDNALKYSRPEGEVFVTVDSADSHVSVTIEDFGAGIRETDLPHIFKRFYRADQARSGGGHGLGLSLAESIVSAHGGEIEVTSREGAGSRFRVVFKARVSSMISANLQFSAVPSSFTQTKESST